MCLYPKLIINPKYQPNGKTGDSTPIPDSRVKYAPIGCGNCMECVKQKATAWQARLLEEIKTSKNAKFVTFTFNNQSIKDLTKEIKSHIKYKVLKSNIKTRKQSHHYIRIPHYNRIKGYNLDNEIANHAIRLFLERYRKYTGKSIKHWLITELGHEGTENIHMHGIIWTKDSLRRIEKIWSYGFLWKGKKELNKITRRYELINYVNDRTVSYMTKYVTQKDHKHKHYKPIILTSSGIGKNYPNTPEAQKNKFKGKETNETYRTRQGHKIGLPMYWRNKIYSDDEKEQLWIYKLDSQFRWVCGTKCDISKDLTHYIACVQHFRRKNKELGYGSSTKDYDQEEYENKQRQIMQLTRINNASNSFGIKAIALNK